MSFLRSLLLVVNAIFVQGGSRVGVKRENFLAVWGAMEARLNM